MADRRVCRRRPAPDTVRLVQGTAWGGLAQSRQRSGVAVGASAGRLTGTCRYQIARASEVAMLPGRAGLQRGTDRPLHTVTIARETVSPGRLVFALHFHDLPIVQALDPKMRRAGVVSFGLGIGL